MKNIFNKLNRIAVFLGLLLGAFAISVLADWTPPQQTPPEGNVAAPLNVNYGGQTKSGSLLLGGLQSLGVTAQYGLLVENGLVGIGTLTPTAKLEVKGGTIKATDGLIIETRTADPTSPENGRMWLVVP